MKLHQTEIKQKRKYTSVLLLPALKILLHSVFVFSHICAVTNTQLLICPSLGFLSEICHP